MSRKNFANNEIIQSDTVTTKNLICTKHDELWFLWINISICFVVWI